MRIKTRDRIPSCIRTMIGVSPLGGALGCLLLLAVSCARMGTPDGGWYDETPPKVTATSPNDKGTGVDSRRIHIYFDEFIKLDNPNENVIISPPQLEAPEIKGQGKRISIEIKDTLKANTTYTIDFSNAISDNNEGNPLGNYTYSFSTGDHIDTLEVSGYVLDACDLEPVKGMLVGLYDNHSDTIFRKIPMLRVSRTDSKGHFTVKGIAPGKYRIYALQDADGDFVFGQKSEMIAYSRTLIEPSFRPDTRQDTTWLDSIHIKSVVRVPYTRFTPDDICLRAFHETMTDRYLIKSERKDPDHFTLFYSYGDSILPRLRGLNFDAERALLTESSENKDTLTYWLLDPALVDRDTLMAEVTHHITDSTGVLRMQTDTLTLLSKQSYAKRMKERQKAFETWQKTQEKKKKKGEPYDSVMPVEPLKLSISPNGEMAPDNTVSLVSPVPLNDVRADMVHLFSKPPTDTLWYREPFEMTRRSVCAYTLVAEWRPGSEYSLEIDSAAFTSIYATATPAVKQGFKIRSDESFSTLLVVLTDMAGKNVIGQLMDKSDKVVKEVYVSNGQLEFYYLRPETYYLRIIVDENNNHRWDTGNYDEDRQPEMVYYYPEEIECKAKWDVTRTWNPQSTLLYRQKPAVITKQKGEKGKSVQNRNAERARRLGIEYIPNMK